VPFSRRRLPHLHEIATPVFLTWRLDDSLPPNREFPKESMTSGAAFAAMDRLLDVSSTGPLYLRDPKIAEMVIDSMAYCNRELKHFTLHVFVIMPNHVHVLLTPLVPLPKLMKSLKSFTGRRANQMLGLADRPFWQEESYDHLVRNQSEFDRIACYIEQNPVRAGLARTSSEFPFSSAFVGRTSRSAAGL
jgi:REP element-mobilizing transposase RayT